MSAIKTWLSELFHHHKWKILQHSQLTSKGDYIGTIYQLQCSHCGKLKSVTLKISI